MLGETYTNSNIPPPVANWPLYIYRVIAKLFCFFVFGLGTVALVISVFPVMSLLFHPKTRFSRYARRFISAAFRFHFVNMMRLMKAITLDVDDREKFRRLSSKIVVANHPSLLDVVIMISLIPNADVIARGNLTRNIIVRWVVNRLYILNSLDFNVLADACIRSLNEGNCLIIFPQGTRTPRSGEIHLKKGAARIALLSGRSIVPVYIGGNDKLGLGKYDHWYDYNHTERYVYRIRMQEEINPAQYADLEIPKAVRRLNNEIRESLINPKRR
ncbi:MAG: 1-acyl-sn-glycerol-3-phosphate acyltransferase [Treponema sp.]|jgi:1-acyl-sn-glycerol-3-phosphate acyltransferase|nr:1-acyl-sn-glycerol-3-phosphate acyltransferase [Treponema sp.]